jgi:hypothetical protein
MSVKKNGRTNRYTLWTFICLNFSFLGFFFYDGLNITLKFAKYVAANKDEEKAIE